MGIWVLWSCTSGPKSSPFSSRIVGCAWKVPSSPPSASSSILIISFCWIKSPSSMIFCFAYIKIILNKTYIHKSCLLNRISFRPTLRRYLIQCKQSELSLALHSTLARRIRVTFFTTRCQSSLKMWSRCRGRLP